MSKYWETGEKNKFGKECYKLHFTQFYDDEVEDFNKAVEIMNVMRS